MTTTAPATITVTWKTRTCPVCGVHYALDADFYSEKYRTNGSWYCPNGHSLIFTQTAADKLKKELDAAQSRARALENHSEYLSGQLRETEKALTIKKGLLTRKTNELTKVKTRVAGGVCPACNRTFQNLARHFETRHADYAKEHNHE